MALLAIASFFLLGGKDKTRTDPEAAINRSGARAGAEDSDPEKVADQALNKARDAGRKGADLDLEMRLWNDAVRDSEKTSRLSQAVKGRDALLLRRKEAYGQELSRIQESIQSLTGRGEWKKAADLLRTTRTRHEAPEWTAEVDRALVSVLEKEKAAAAAEEESKSLNLVPRDGVSLWLRADAGIIKTGDRVSRWTDQSASHHDAWQDAPAAQPILLPTAAGGRPAVSFDGMKSSMTFLQPVNGLEGMTIFLVSTCLRDLGAGTGSDSAALYWDATDPVNGKLYLSSFQSGVRFKFGTGQPVKSDISFRRPSSLETRPTLVVIRKEGPEDSLFTDGTPAVRQAGMGPKIAGCKDQASIGIGKNNTHFSGSISEILIYPRPLPDGERQRVEHYLMEKYALPSR